MERFRLSEDMTPEEHNRQLIEEMAHRSKNLLTVVTAISHQLAKTSGSLPEFEARFSARLQALGGIQNVTAREDWRGCSMQELIHSQLAHCSDLLGRRIFLEGSPVSLSAQACQYIGMALHELGTNALKYGALAGEAGTVTIRWSPEPAGLRIDWIEAGGPPVAPPIRQGFGHKVTTEIVKRALDAEVTVSFRKEGMCWSLAVPARHVLPRTPAVTASLASTAEAPNTA